MKHHEGFKEKLIARAEQKQGLNYLKMMTKSAKFFDVEQALNSSGKGRGKLKGVYIDHEKLINAIENAHKKCKSQKNKLPLKAKTKRLDKALKICGKLLEAIDALNGRYEDFAVITDIQIRLKHKINKVKDEHNWSSITRSIKKTEGLTQDQAVFCRWLYVFIAVDYPEYPFTKLIASIANCISTEPIDYGMVETNLRTARAKLDSHAEYLREEFKKEAMRKPVYLRGRKKPEF